MAEPANVAGTVDAYAYDADTAAWYKIGGGGGGGAYLPLTGGALSGGISFGSQVAPGGVTDNSRHIELYSGGWGINITSGKMNLTSPTTGSYRIILNSNAQPQIAKADGTSARDIIDTTNGDARYVQQAGDTMTGDLNVTGAKRVTIAGTVATSTNSGEQILFETYSSNGVQIYRISQSWSSGTFNTHISNRNNGGMWESVKIIGSQTTHPYWDFATAPAAMGYVDKSLLADGPNVRTAPLRRRGHLFDGVGVVEVEPVVRSVNGDTEEEHEFRQPRQLAMTGLDERFRQQDGINLGSVIAGLVAEVQQLRARIDELEASRNG